MPLPIDDNVSEAAVIAGAVAQQMALTVTAKGHRRPASKLKKDQLLALIAKPGGAKISVLSERLGWQAHTVRAALSRLRGRGHHVLATKAPKTGEAIYRLVTPMPEDVSESGVKALEV